MVIVDYFINGRGEDVISLKRIVGDAVTQDDLEAIELAVETKEFSDFDFENEAAYEIYLKRNLGSGCRGDASFSIMHVKEAKFDR